ncbi:LamG-like jellyroll fold domain-containing protein [Pseudoduganella namucuonensis]|uniref:Alginate lyase n=1 Tax=Pseudoduganella namucuonensis TaxID=1035707 RepID=A0A1I7LHB0_9BURK|nr:LamG-like jellyroll fold domain-containing protein [Pseudoduganella namucuonensis]SFV09059.1 Alginate lyase [Pseudoduganella namucuonensis]
MINTVEDVIENKNAEISRRTFLYSLGALALAGCGGGLGGDGQGGAPGALAAARQGGKPPGAFIHPGLLHTDADFTRMAAKYTTSPWSGSWNLLINNSHASLGYTARPVPIVYRGSDGVHAQNFGLLFSDVAAAYACALRWKVSGNPDYANKAVEIMNAWSAVLTSIQGSTEAALAAGLQGYEFANAAEIMRGYSGWAAADFTRFRNMMLNVFYPINHDFLIRHNGTEITHYWANWDLCNLASILAISVLCDDQAKWDEAINYLKGESGNGGIGQAVYFLHPGHLGQWQESGRDQGHATLGIALLGAICEMAWNQGEDLYGHDNNRFLAGAEYVAKSNLIESGGTYYTVPYVRYNNIDNVNQTVFSTSAQGHVRPCWALVYNHYVNRKGLAAPHSKRFALQIQPEGGGSGSGSGGYDQLGYGTLTCTRDPIASGAAPSGLTAHTMGGAVVLSWWGSAYATGYTLKRATTPGGPYTTVASGITDPLTYSDSGLAAGTYYYVVSATTSTGTTANSNETKAVVGVQLHTLLAFNESGGTVAADASGQGHAGTLAGGAIWVPGKKNNAVSLNGSSGYVSLPAGIMSDVGDATIACWVYWNASRAWERVFDFGSGTGHYMMLTPRAGNTGPARFAITVNGWSNEQNINSTAALPTGQWVHVAVTLSGGTGRLYVNGVQAGVNTGMFLAPFRLQNTTRNWIGRSQYPDPYFNGKIDEFRIYRGALSAAEVAALMTA